MHVSNLITEENLLKLPKINFDELKFLWANDWWDGAISGMLIYQNEKCQFELICENDDTNSKDYYRRFLVIKLTVKQIEQEEYWHNLFKEKVGTHYDLDDNGVRQIETPAQNPKTEELHQEFYDAYQKSEKIDLSNNEFLGYYEI